MQRCMKKTAVRRVKIFEEKNGPINRNYLLLHCTFNQYNRFLSLLCFSSSFECILINEFSISINVASTDNCHGRQCHFADGWESLKKN